MVISEKSRVCWFFSHATRRNFFRVETIASPMGASCERVGWLYDAVLSILSIVDAITTILVLVQWQTDGRIIFFGIGMTIILLVQLLISIFFYWAHGEPVNGSLTCATCISISSIICLLILAPFLWFIWLFTTSKKSKLRKWINTCFNFDWNRAYILDNNDFKYGGNTAENKYTWIHERMQKNVILLIQAIFGSLPQLILQLIATLYYKDTNDALLSGSILSSILVLSSVTIMILESINFDEARIKTIIYVCLCIITDCIGLIFMITFIFYSDKVREMYIWEGIICIAPVSIAIITAIAYYFFSIFIVDDILFNSNERFTYKFYVGCGTGLGIVICGIPIVLTIAALLCIPLIIISVVWTVFVIKEAGIDSRLPSPWMSSRPWYNEHIEWVLNSKRNQEKIIKLHIMNKCILDEWQGYTFDLGWGNYHDTGLKKYLEEKGMNNYRDVSLTEMRLKCNQNSAFGDRENGEYAGFWPQIMKKYYLIPLTQVTGEFKAIGGENKKCHKCFSSLNIIFFGSATYIFGPIYLLSRIFNLLMPFIMILYLYIDDINLLIDMDIFPIMIWSIYAFVIVLWFISFCIQVWNEYWLQNILPTTQYIRGGCTLSEFPHYTFTDANEEHSLVKSRIRSQYFMIKEYPLIEKILEDKFGSDIVKVIVYHLGNMNMSDWEVYVENLLCNIYGIHIAQIVLLYVFV